MKEQLRELLAAQERPGQRRWLAREYLQARLLQGLQEAGAFARWIFQDGTALRFLHGLPRFSEDLDFSLGAAEPAGDFSRALAEARRAFLREGYAVEARLKPERTVRAAFLDFPGLPRELGLSPRREEKLAVKVELDTAPPGGGATVRSIVRRHAALHLWHYDRATLLAGKIIALLRRPWTKGRDVFDLAWLLADRSWPAPNLDYLNRGLQQGNWTGPALDGENWRGLLAERLRQLDWTTVGHDLRPFLEREEDEALAARDSVLELVAGGRR